MDTVETISQFITDPEIALILISYALAIFGFYKGWVVPRFIFDREVTRADKATDAGEKIADALEELTREIRERRERV